MAYAAETNGVTGDTVIVLENNHKFCAHLVHDLDVSAKLGICDIYRTDELSFSLAYALLYTYPQNIYYKA